MRICLGLWVAAWAAAACAAGDAEPVRIALVRDAAAAPLYIAAAAGYFKAEGLEPKLRFLEGTDAVAAAVASGSADLGLSALSARFYRYAAAHRLKIIASEATEQSGFPIFALLIGNKARASGVSDVRQLVGRRIGISEAERGAYYGLASALARFGVDAGRVDVQWSKSVTPELAALSRGDLDAVLLPYPTAIGSAGKGGLLLRLSDLAVWQEGIVFASAEKIEARRPLVERFMHAYQRGSSDYQLNFLNYDDAGDFIPGPAHDKYLRVISTQAQVPAGLLEKIKTYCDRRASLDAGDIAKQVRFWQERGELDRRVAAADLIDLSFLGEESVRANQ